MILPDPVCKSCDRRFSEHDFQDTSLCDYFLFEGDKVPPPRDYAKYEERANGTYRMKNR